MKSKHDHIFFPICLIVAMFFFALFSQEARALPSKSDIVNKMILVNDYWINGHLDSKYYKYAEDWAIKWDWKLNGYIWLPHNEFKIVEGNPTGLDAAVLSLDLGIKQLQFSWPAVQNATYYRLMENPDGVSGFTQRGADISTTSHTLDIAVHRQNWGNARYLLQACNSHLCSDSNEVSTLGGVLSAIGYVKASNNGKRSYPTRGGDGFGRSVALSDDGNTLVVGAREEDSGARGISTDGTGEDSNTAFEAGAVYVFDRSGGSWTQQAYVKASNTEMGDWFGTSVALSSDGNTLAVGASLEFFGTGAVYVFSRNNSGWSEQTSVRASNGAMADLFGTSVALSSDGNTLVVGADGEASNAIGISIDGSGEEDNSAAYAGAVYVFSRSGGNWSQQAYVKASNTGANDGFGASVALGSNGNTLVVGSRGEDSNATGINTDGASEADNSATRAGAVYIFSRNGGSWSQQAYVKASNAEAYDGFGGSVNLSDDGNTLVVGAGGEDSNATGISADGIGEGDNSVSSAGAVYVFSRSSDSWSQQAYVKASNTETGDGFGGSVNLSGDGNTLVVRAGGEDSNATGISSDGTGEGDNSVSSAGAVYVFSRSSGNWVQQAYVKASNTGTGDGFGSVVLSRDGNTLAVGAFEEDGNATGITHGADAIGADNSESFAGAVYLY